MAFVGKGLWEKADPQSKVAQTPMATAWRIIARLGRQVPSTDS
jgi:hypothetical protein